MRITAAHAYRAQIESLRLTCRDSFEAQRKASSGKRIERASDDPTGFHRATLMKAMKSDLGHARKKMDLARVEISTAEQALDGMGNIMSRLRELSVQMASDLMGTEERANAAVEVDTLKDSMIALANVRHGDKRLFAGHQTDGEAFDATGAYLGDSGQQEVAIAEGSNVALTFAGDEVLRGASGGPDIFQMMDDLSTALAADDTAGIQDSLTTIDEGQQHLLDYRSDVGGRLNLIQALGVHFEGVEVSLLNDISTVEGADPLESFSEVIRTRQAFESAMQVSVNSRTQSIFDLL